MVQPLWKIVCQFLTKQKLNIWSRNCTPWYLCAKDLKNRVHTKTCTQVCRAALFKCAKTWKQPRCHSVGERIHKLWYIQAVGYYTVLDRNELSSHKRHGGNKYILLSERVQYEKSTFYIDSLKKAKIWRQWIDRWLPKFRGKGGVNRWDTQSLVKILYDIIMMDFLSLCIYPNSYIFITKSKP